MTSIHYIAQHVTASEKQIQNTLELLQNDCTIPFIARYRKDATGNLDEVVIEQIAVFFKTYEAIVKRKEAIVKAIESLGLLTPELNQKIANCFEVNELEDLYLPFKKKKKTKADTARENGL